MSADSLLAALRTAGLQVVEQPKWRTRGNRWAKGKPEGCMQHHTSLPDPYPIRRLYGPLLYRIKANMATHPDGTLYLIAYRACNYSSGPGSRKVLTGNVRPGIPPDANAKHRGLWDTMGGNRHFWNYENSHPGDGSPIPDIQLDTIVTSTRIVLDHFDLDPGQVISHAEWTRRKIDPYWNGGIRQAITEIRQQLRGDDMAAMSDEAQQFFEDTYREMLKLDPPTSASFAKVLIEHVRDHPTAVGLGEDDADTRYIRKGQPVVIRGAE